MEAKSVMLDGAIAFGFRHLINTFQEYLFFRASHCGRISGIGSLFDLALEWIVPGTIYLEYDIVDVESFISASLLVLNLLDKARRWFYSWLLVHRTQFSPLVWRDIILLLLVKRAYHILVNFLAL